MNNTTICHNIEKMYALGQQFANQITVPSLITFEGPLGAGKTTFIQGLLKAWGYQQAVTSPTFSLVHEYHDLHQGQQTFNVAHFDCYRLKNPQELEDLGFRDYLDEQTVCLIEWPSKAEGIIPKAQWHLQLDHHEDGRSITITKV